MIQINLYPTMIFLAVSICKLVLNIRGVCGAVWFGVVAKSLSNRKIKKHAVWFGLVDF